MASGRRLAAGTAVTPLGGCPTQRWPTSRQTLRRNQSDLRGLAGTLRHSSAECPSRECRSDRHQRGLARPPQLVTRGGSCRGGVGCAPHESSPPDEHRHRLAASQVPRPLGSPFPCKARQTSGGQGGPGVHPTRCRRRTRAGVPRASSGSSPNWAFASRSRHRRRSKARIGGTPGARRRGRPERAAPRRPQGLRSKPRGGQHGGHAIGGTRHEVAHRLGGRGPGTRRRRRWPPGSPSPS